MTASEKQQRAEREQEAIDHRKRDEREGLANQNVTGASPPATPRKEAGDKDASNGKPGNLADRNVTGTQP